MRELKFRAWNKKGKRWLGVNLHMSVIDGTLWWQFGIGCSILSAEERENIELMQYTGLKDKNGKEAYEGDIVKYFWLSKKHIKPITWDVSRAGFIAGFTIDLGEYDGSSAVEIIGNIYENPELMEADQ